MLLTCIDRMVFMAIITNEFTPLLTQIWSKVIESFYMLPAL